MKSKGFKIITGAVLLLIFFGKIAMPLAPLFSFMNTKTASSVIMQLEHETKTDKEDQDKEMFKDKKLFGEQLLSFFEYKSLVGEMNVLHTLENSLYIQTYHPVVPTPPPNA